MSIHYLKTTLTTVLAVVLMNASVNHLSAQESAPQLDFGDFSSATLTGKAWKASEAKNYKETLAYAEKCVEMYMGEAVKQQGNLEAPAPKESASEHWALNDVGTCLFIIGQTYENMGEKAKALEAYQKLATQLPFSQCWDTKGWFWGPGEAAKKKVSELEFAVMQES
jgi:tetratricopeptide (TPR) repeat protein